jgi:hypothetical protein
MGRPGDNAATVLDAFMPRSLGAVNIERKQIVARKWPQHPDQCVIQRDERAPLAG